MCVAGILRDWTSRTVAAVKVIGEENCRGQKPLQLSRESCRQPQRGRKGEDDGTLAVNGTKLVGEWCGKANRER